MRELWTKLDFYAKIGFILIGLGFMLTLVTWGTKSVSIGFWAIGIGTGWFACITSQKKNK